MPKIVQIRYFNGAQMKIRRLGLRPLLDEVDYALRSFRLAIFEEKNSNSSAVLRQMIDAAFDALGGWHKSVVGDIDWHKCRSVEDIQVCVGVEVQVSARSDLIFRDVVHFRNKMIAGLIDLAVLILPSDDTAYFLTDRTPRMSDGLRIVQEEMKIEDLPLVLIALGHEGTSDVPLPKKRTNRGGSSKDR